MSIPEEVLNCDSTELSESTELQTSEATGGSDAPLSEVDLFKYESNCLSHSHMIPGSSSNVHSLQTKGRLERGEG